LRKRKGSLDDRILDEIRIQLQEIDVFTKKLSEEKARELRSIRRLRR